MEQAASVRLTRRDWTFKVLPSCAALGLGPRRLLASSGQGSEGAHKFDDAIEFPRPPTYRQYLRAREQKFIRFCKSLVEELGEEKALAIIRGYTERRMLEVGQRGAKRNGDDGFKSYIGMFKQPVMLKTLSFDIIEDTSTAYEIRVTECLSHEIYRAEGCDGELGYACVCHGDYAWAEGHNPKIGLIRDKTLMQGHDCCNHRYVWKG